MRSIFDGSLKPCPFCGGKAVLQQIGAIDQYRVICTNEDCCAETHAPYGEHRGEWVAIERWNRRVNE